MKDKSKPDRAQGEARNIKKQQKEATERHEVKMKSAQTEMQMGVASGQVGSAAAAGRNKKPEAGK